MKLLNVFISLLIMTLCSVTSGMEACSNKDECPQGGDCERAVCIRKTCRIVSRRSGARCTDDNSLGQCDGEGTCVTFPACKVADCPQGNECQKARCNNRGQCVLANRKDVKNNGQPRTCTTENDAPGTCSSGECTPGTDECQDDSQCDKLCQRGICDKSGASNVCTTEPIGIEEQQTCAFNPSDGQGGGVCVEGQCEACGGDSAAPETIIRPGGMCDSTTALSILPGNMQLEFCEDACRAFAPGLGAWAQLQLEAPTGEDALCTCFSGECQVQNSPIQNVFTFRVCPEAA